MGLIGNAAEVHPELLRRDGFGPDDVTDQTSAHDPLSYVVDAAGRVHVVDWDDLRLAPPEQDARFLIDLPRLDLALGAYEETAGPTRLDADVFGFYFHRRVLVDLAYFLCRVLRPDRTDAYDAHDLAIVRSDCFWAFDGGIGARVGELRAALAGRRGTVCCAPAFRQW